MSKELPATTQKNTQGNGLGDFITITEIMGLAGNNCKRDTVINFLRKFKIKPHHKIGNCNIYPRSIYEQFVDYRIKIN